MPLLVAAMVNLLAVPIGSASICWSFSPPPAAGCGTASKAAREAPVPDEPELWTTHTTADDGSVPLEVTTGEPELKPNVYVLLAASVSTGRPVLSAPSWKARR